MENVLTAFFVVFIILLAVLLLGFAVISTVDSLQVSWRAMQDRGQDIISTQINPVEGWVNSTEANVEVTYRNEGTTRLADYAQWDVIVQYTDGGGAQHILWLPYAGTSPLQDNQWTVGGLYADYARDIEEVVEPGIFNPGETILLQVRLQPGVGVGQPAHLVVAVGNGLHATSFFIRNYPPELITNNPTSLMSRTSAAIDSSSLHATDTDNSADELTFQVTTPPAQGNLSLEDVFTQADIDSGRVTYTHTGSGDDTFAFTLSDGRDTVGPYTYNITATNAPPELVVNEPLTVMNFGIGSITPLHLSVIDVDDPPQDLVYTVVVGPSQGSLNLGSLFTQDDIDRGLLQYTHTGVGGDSFQFTVGDGDVIIGVYQFSIIVQ